MASVTIPCPSCEAGFAVKESLIGKKVDCPKCKYRFKAELPGDEDDAPKSKKSDKAKKGGNNTLVIGGVIGALALILLGVGGYMLFAGGDEGPKKPSASNTSSNNNSSSQSSNSSSTTNPGNTETPNTNGENPTEGNKAGETNSAAGTEASKPKPVKAGELKDVTNLLHGEAISVYKVVVDRLIQTPIYNAVFDKSTQEFFRNSLTFDASDIETYHHCVINPDRTPFAVFRLKRPLDESALLNRIENVKGPQSPIKGRYYNTIKSNPFLDAIGRALSSEAIRGEAGVPVTEEEKKKWGENKPLAYHVYDSQTLIIADQLDLERFLNDLDDKGDPPMKSILTPDAPPAEGTPPTGEGAPGGGEGGRGGEGRPMGPGGKGGAPGGGSGIGMFGKSDKNFVYLQQGSPPPRGQIGDGGRGGRGGPGGPPPGIGNEGGQGNTPAARPRKSFSSNPHYRTVDEQLKYMLNRLEDEDSNNMPAVVYAEILDQRIFNQRLLSALFRATGDTIFGLLSQIKVVGVAIRVFNKDKFVASAAFEFQNEEDARQSTGRFIQPLLEQITPLLSLVFGTQIDIRNNSGGGGGGSPGGGLGGTDISGPPAGGQGSAGPRGGPGGPGGPRGGPGGGSVGPRPRGGPGGPGGPGGAIDGGEGGFNPGGNENNGPNLSFISVSLADRATILNMEVLWNEERYKKFIVPQIVTAANQLKGRMSVLSGETTWHSLAAAFPKMAAGKKPFPRGTMEREIMADRYGLPFPPEQRVSFLADLLPYIGRGGLYSKIEKKKMPWYGKDNVDIAQEWVPEFLVPYYPQQSWRAFHPLAEGKVLGATNFVGLSGLGLDSARFNPSNPEHAKKIGITGYNWGSTLGEISDGASNTIYMIQTPPGVQRAWMAGGGATIMGVDDTIANPISDFVHTTPDKRRGTYALMADGSVRWLTESTDPKVFKGMVTRAGGESLGDLDKLAPKVDPPKGFKVELSGSRLATNTTKPNEKPAPSTTDKVDAEELKKFQGDWKVITLYVKGQRLTKEQVEAAGIVIKIEDKIIRLESKSPQPMWSSIIQLTELDPKKSPKEFTATSLEGSDKGKSNTKIYEFVGDKVNIRFAEQGKPTPKQLIVPEAGSTDNYLELMRVQ